MLARLHVILPVSLTVPEGESFPIHSYVDEGCTIQIYPPMKSDQPACNVEVDQLLIDQKPAFQANRLRIDFVKDDFNRRPEVVCDPSHDLIRRTVNFFVRRVRFVTRGSQISLVNFPEVSWHLQYLNEDETELPKDKGLVRGRGGYAFTISWIALTRQVWDEIHALPVNYEPPEWDSLYLDAEAALPDIGSSIILAATSLEVFISHVLNALALKSVTPQTLWQWINSRQWLKEPAVEEQFGDLLKILLGVSLKENQTLWEAFKNLKKARNSFVHEGIAMIGEKPVTEADARKLVHQSAEILKFIRSKLPVEIRWPEYQHNINVQIQKKFFG